MGRVISTDRYLCNTAGMHALHSPQAKILRRRKRFRWVVLEQPSATSPPFFRQSPFRTFRQIFQGGFVVDTFVEMFEIEIVTKKGTSCRLLFWNPFFILRSAIFGLKVMKRPSKTTHRNLFRRLNIFAW
jgi:hypothetical protein